MATRTSGLGAGVVLAVLACAPAGLAGNPPADTPTRAAVRRGLDYVAAGGDWWIENKGCASCHHLPFVIWTHNEAIRAGMPVDSARLSAWTNWTLTSMLAGKGAGVDTMYQVLLGRDRGSVWRAKPRLHRKTVDPYEALWQLLLEQQNSDGSWKPGGQLLSPAEITTAWTVLGLSSRDEHDRAAGIDPQSGLGPDLAELVRRVDAGLPMSRRRAVEWLAGRPAAPGTEARMLRMLLAKSQNDPRWPELLADLRSRQNADGGWAYLEDDKTSNAFATGQVMWALKQAGAPPSDPTLIRARDWLLRAQTADGSWPVRTAEIHPVAPARAVRTDPIFRFWGSAWGTIGLLQTLPPAAAVESTKP